MNLRTRLRRLVETWRPRLSRQAACLAVDAVLDDAFDGLDRDPRGVDETDPLGPRTSTYQFLWHVSAS